MAQVNNHLLSVVQVSAARPHPLVATATSPGSERFPEVSRAGRADQHLPGILT